MKPSQMHTFRVYTNGSVVHEDDFEEYDNIEPLCDDYATYTLPDELLAHIAGEDWRNT